MRRAGPWAVLDIDPTDDRREVKRAYSRILKTIDVDADPAAFVRLREALDTALAWGSRFEWYDEDEAEVPSPAADAAAPVGEPADVEGAYDDQDDQDEEEEEYLDWAGWDTRVAPPAEGAVAGLCRELDEALTGETVPAPERVAALGEAILAHADLGHLDRAREVEQWLADAIASSFPRSDPLVDPAIVHFGWDKGGSLRRDWAVARVVQRSDDRRFLAAASRHFHGHNAALEELRGPPRRRLGLGQLHLAGDVRKFLDVVKERDTLTADLDPDSLAWWEAYFRGPHLPPHFWLWLLGWTCLLAAVGGALLSSAEGTAVGALAVVGGAGLLSFAGVFGWSRFKAAQRAQAEAAQYDDARPRGAERWAAGALLLPLLASLAPGHPAVAAVTSGAALWLGWGIFRRGWTEPEWMGLRPGPRIFLPAVAAAASLFALALTTPWEAAVLALPLAVLSWAGSHCFRPIEAWLLDRPARVRVQAAGAGLLLVVGGLAAIALGLAVWPPPLVLVVAVPVAIVAGHLATSASTIDVHVVEWPLRGALVLGFIFGRPLLPLPFFEIGFVLVAAYGLGYTLMRTAAVLRDEARRPAVGAEA